MYSILVHVCTESYFLTENPYLIRNIELLILPAHTRPLSEIKKYFVREGV
jgi:hypothetical protein